MNKRQTIHSKYSERRRNNVASIPPRTTKLLCGHFVTRHPIVIYASRRELYNCPLCKRFVKAVAR